MCHLATPTLGTQGKEIQKILIPWKPGRRNSKNIHPAGKKYSSSRQSRGNK